MLVSVPSPLEFQSQPLPNRSSQIYPNKSGCNLCLDQNTDLSSCETSSWNGHWSAAAKRRVSFFDSLWYLYPRDSYMDLMCLKIWCLTQQPLFLQWLVPKWKGLPFYDCYCWKRSKLDFWTWDVCGLQLMKQAISKLFVTILLLFLLFLPSSSFSLSFSSSSSSSCSYIIYLNHFLLCRCVWSSGIPQWENGDTPLEEVFQSSDKLLRHTPKNWLISMYIYMYLFLSFHWIIIISPSKRDIMWEYLEALQFLSK